MSTLSTLLQWDMTIPNSGRRCVRALYGIDAAENTKCLYTRLKGVLKDCIECTPEQVIMAQSIRNPMGNSTPLKEDC